MELLSDSIVAGVAWSPPGEITNSKVRFYSGKILYQDFVTELHDKIRKQKKLKFEVALWNAASVRGPIRKEWLQPIVEDKE